MSGELLVAMLVPIATLLLGSGLTFWAEEVRQRRTRRDRLSDSLLERRTAVYLEFLDECHATMHFLARMMPGCPDPLPHDSEVYWSLDSKVTRHYRRIAVVGSDSVSRSAWDVVLEMRKVRESSRHGDVAYDSPQYLDEYGRYQTKRDAFISRVRAETVPS